MFPGRLARFALTGSTDADSTKLLTIGLARHELRLQYARAGGEGREFKAGSE
jgi:hypothetical protein